jgi:hypothetical protein
VLVENCTPVIAALPGGQELSDPLPAVAATYVGSSLSTAGSVDPAVSVASEEKDSSDAAVIAKSPSVNARVSAWLWLLN